MNEAQSAPRLSELWDEYSRWSTDQISLMKALPKPSPFFYVSGPISGFTDLNRPNFEAACRHIRAHNGYHMNPLDLFKQDTLKQMALSQDDEWDYCMKIDLKHLFECGAVFMLPGWDKSMGATWEFLNARALNMPVIDYTGKLVTMDKNQYIELFSKITSKLIKNDQKLLLNYPT